MNIFKTVSIIECDIFLTFKKFNDVGDIFYIHLYRIGKFREIGGQNRSCTVFSGKNFKELL